jgi:hypothetical protein
MAGMTDRNMDELARWMAAEQGASWDEADALFAGVASRYLPLTEAPAGLTVRIMAAVPHRAASLNARAMGDVASSWWGRLTVAAALAVLGAALSAVSAGQLFDLAAFAVEALARISHGVSTSLTAALGIWGVSWTLLMSLGRAAMLVTTSGAVPALIAASLLLAITSFAGLTRLLAPREECS